MRQIIPRLAVYRSVFDLLDGEVAPTRLDQLLLCVLERRVTVLTTLAMDTAAAIIYTCNFSVDPV